MRILTMIVCLLWASISLSQTTVPPKCWELDTSGFVGCGQVEYFVDCSDESRSEMRQYLSTWVLWRDDDDTFIMYFDRKLPEVSENANKRGYPSRCWSIPGDPAESAPLFNSGRAWRPVGTVIVLQKSSWEKFSEGGTLRSYFQKVLSEVVPEGQRRYSGDVVQNVEVATPVLAKK